MAPEHVRLVQSSFEQVKPMAETAARLFYDRLFEIEPGLRHLFKGDATEQGRKLMQMIGYAVRELDRPEQMLASVRALGARHAAYGVRDQDYATVGAALLWTLAQGLGAAFTADVREAWAEVYALLSGAMKDAAAMATAA